MHWFLPYYCDQILGQEQFEGRKHSHWLLVSEGLVYGHLGLGTHHGDRNIYVGRGDLTFDRKLREKEGIGDQVATRPH